MKPRKIEKKVKEYAKKFPIITITGPRQSGKTTLCKMLFPQKPYISLEGTEERRYAAEDPKGFLNQYPEGAIIDEVQRVPELLSDIQVISDEKNKEGLFILAGSQQFQILSKISQSLAGRTALVKLLPFSMGEAYDNPEKTDINTVLYTGFYPRIFDKKINPTDMLSFYTNTYIERDVRQLINIKDISKFETFIKLCAGRTGQLLNLSNLGNECDVNHNTIKSWLSILEASYLIKLMHPYHKNINKRLVKSPKLYFLDVGLAAYLIGINDSRQIETHPLRGELFETFIVTELIKTKLNNGNQDNSFFYRDHKGNEIDIILDNGFNLDLIEIKSAQTIKPSFWKGFSSFPKLPKTAITQKIIYGGTQNRAQNKTEIISWQNIEK